MRSAPALFVIFGLLRLGGVATADKIQQVQCAPPALSVSIAAPEDNGTRVVDLSMADPHIDVIIRNVSSRPVAIYAEDNSVGYNNLHLDIYAFDGKHLPQPIIVQRVVISGTGNNIHTVTLGPGDSVVREVHFTRDEPMQGVHYSNFPSMNAGEKHLMRMRAVFEYGGQPCGFNLFFHRKGFATGSKIASPTEANTAARIWTGSVASATTDYQINQF